MIYKMFAREDMSCDFSEYSIKANTLNQAIKKAKEFIDWGYDVKLYTLSGKLALRTRNAFTSCFFCPF